MLTTRTIPSQLKDPTDKTAYPKCSMKKEHSNESLNLICLTKTCKFHGPICVMCKKQHVGHNVVTIKAFLVAVGETNKKHGVGGQGDRHDRVVEEKEEGVLPIQEKKLQRIQRMTALEKLQESFKEAMAVLHYHVQDLSEQIRKTEHKMIAEFQHAKATIEEEYIKSEVIKEGLEFMNAKNYEDANDFRRNIGKILKNMEFNKNDAKIQINEQKILKSYQTSIQEQKDNLIFIQTQLKELYSMINDKDMKEKIEKIEKLQKPIDHRPKTAKVSMIKPQNVTFSPPILKPSTFLIQKEGKSVKQKENNSNKIIFMQNGLSSKVQEITIKITQCQGIIFLGIALKDKIKQKAYRFQKQTLGHGAYMLASNGYKYNNSEKAEDGTMTGFGFEKGDEVVICFKAKEKKLIFVHMKDGEKKKVVDVSLKSLPETSFKELEFCVVLNALGDKVEIL